MSEELFARMPKTYSTIRTEFKTHKIYKKHYDADEIDEYFIEVRAKFKEVNDKLEAINTHFKNFPVSTRSVNQWIRQGLKILETEA